jgi:putative polyketide hydroxylase
MSQTHTPVLIVGGGLTGLSSAVFLAWHQVPCTLVERHPDLLIHPRLRGLTPRTVELLRQLGLEPAIREASFTDGDAFTWTPVLAETLAGEHTRPDEEGEAGGAVTGASPSPMGAIDQDKLEVLLRDRARELGATICFSTELTSVEQDESGVTAVLTDQDSGARQSLRTDYLIAADGYDSPIRQRLGIESEGPGLLYQAVTAIVGADLTPALRGREVSIAYLRQPRPHTVLMPHDESGGRWVFSVGYSPEEESLDDYTDERVAEMVRTAAGLPGVEVALRPQIPGTDLKVLAFPIGGRLARSYRTGRVFLVGDAAHMVPPTGGLGGNTGIQDAHNLAWKLAAVLHGHANPPLLESYHTERHPIGRFTLGQALARFGTRLGPTDAAAPLVDWQAVAFGYQYRSPAILGATDDASPLLPDELTGAPGTRAPHLPLTRNDAEISTIDLYGRSFVLLATDTNPAWLDAADRVSKALNLPLETYRFGADPTSTEAADAHGITPHGALLVRPDGFVAWRSSPITTEPHAELEHALRAVLNR